MFGLLNGVKVLVVLLPIVMAAGGYYYIQNLQSTIDRLKVNTSKLSDAVNAKDQEIDRLQKNVEEVMKISKEVEAERGQLANEVDSLRQKLSDHDLGFLAEKKPGLVERIINKDIEKSLKGDVLDIMSEEND
jgi:peptidoglycan hydrolase CwlO-like protein